MDREWSGDITNLFDDSSLHYMLRKSIKQMILDGVLECPGIFEDKIEEYLGDFISHLKSYELEYVEYQERKDDEEDYDE